MIKKLAILVFMLIFASSIVLAQTIDVTPSTIYQFQDFIVTYSIDEDVLDNETEYAFDDGNQNGRERISNQVTWYANQFDILENLTEFEFCFYGRVHHFQTVQTEVVVDNVTTGVFNNVSQSLSWNCINVTANLTEGLHYVGLRCDNCLVSKKVVLNEDSFINENISYTSVDNGAVWDLWSSSNIFMIRLTDYNSGDTLENGFLYVQEPGGVISLIATVAGNDSVSLTEFVFSNTSVPGPYNFYIQRGSGVRIVEDIGFVLEFTSELIKQFVEVIPQGVRETEINNTVHNEWKFTTQSDFLNLSDLSCGIYHLTNISTLTFINVSVDTEIESDEGKMVVKWISSSSEFQEGENYEVDCVVNVTIGEGNYQNSYRYDGIEQYVHINREETFLTFLEDIYTFLTVDLWSKMFNIETGVNETLANTLVIVEQLENLSLDISGINNTVDVLNNSLVDMTTILEFTSNTDYDFTEDDMGKEVVHFSQGGNSVNNEQVEIKIYYPNLTTFVNWTNMTFLENGIYYYDFDVVFPLGTYTATARGLDYYASHTFYVNNGLRAKVVK